MSALDSMSLQDLMLLKSKNQDSPENLAILDSRIAALQQTTFGLGDTLAVAGQGAAMGWGDEALAGLQTGFGRLGNYEEARDGNRAYLSGLREQNPGAYIAAELAGGVAAGFIPGLNGVQAINRAKNLGQLALNTGKFGAGVGAVSGAGYSDEEGLGGLAYDTAVGAGTGALFNSAIGTAAPAARAVVNRGRSPDQIIADIAKEAGITPEKVVARMKELGPKATLADAFPKLRETAYGAYGVGGFIEEQGALTARNQTAGGRLMDDLEDQTGRRQGDVRKEEEFLTTQRGQKANEEYAVLEGQSVPFSSAEPLLTSRSNKAQIKNALDEWADETGQTLEDFEVSGEVPAQLLQRIRSLTSEEAKDLAAKSKGGRAAILGRRVTDIDSELRTIPGWDDARKNYAQASEEIDNLARGRASGAVAGKIDRDQGVLEGALNDTPRNRNAYALGSQQQIIDNVMASGGANDTGSVLTRLGNPRQQEIKLQGAGIPGYSKSIDRERTFSETYQMLGENQGSKTNAGRTAADNFTDDSSMATGALRAAIDPSMIGLDALTKVMKKTYGLKNENSARAVLRRLLQTGMGKEEILAVLDTEQGARKLLDMIQRGSGVTGRAGPSSVGVLQDTRTR